MGLVVEREGRGLARRAHHAAGRAGEADEMLALAARGAAASWGTSPAASSSLRRKASWLARPAPGGVGVEQGELVAEQVEDLRVRVAGLEQPRDGVAGARGRVERGGVLAQPWVGGHASRRP